MAPENDRDADEPSSPTCYLADTDPAYSGLVLPSSKTKDGRRRRISAASAPTAAPVEKSERSSDTGSQIGLGNAGGL